MVKKIVLLTKSRKHGGYCTAGVDVETGEWVRIVSSGYDKTTDEIDEDELTYLDGTKAECLDVIQIECVGWRPNYYQPENYVMNRTKKWIKLGEATIDNVLAIHPFEEKQYLFFNSSYRVEDEILQNIEDDLKSSLSMIKIDNPIIIVSTKPWAQDEKSVTVKFWYNGNLYSYIRTTDDEFFGEYYDCEDGEYHLSGSYIAIISLGELYERDNNHYKLIAKVFPYKENVFQNILFR